IGSPRANDHEHLELPEMLEDPYVETEPFETDEFAATPPPHPAYRMIARISIPAPVPMPAWSDSEAPPSTDYIPGPEEPEQAPPSPDYITGPEHADDEIITEDQPYAEDASPIA
nr:hypothetical protein [Tanacetum cinerariifolium]